MVAPWTVSDVVLDRIKSVMVAEPTPASCRSAIDALLDGRIRGVLRADEPGALPAALQAVSDGLFPITEGAMAAAHAVPALTARQVAVLRAVMGGRSNAAIGRRLGVSEATVKREISSLLSSLDAPNRTSIAVAAARLGFKPA